MQLLDHFAVEPATLETLLGERTDVTRSDGEWRLVGLEIDEADVGESAHSLAWDDLEGTKAGEAVIFVSHVVAITTAMIAAFAVTAGVVALGWDSGPVALIWVVMLAVVFKSVGVVDGWVQVDILPALKGEDSRALGY